MPKKIKVKNELPELLEAVCTHKDCPEWLKLGIWEAVNINPKSMFYLSIYWRGEFEAIILKRQEGENDGDSK